MPAYEFRLPSYPSTAFPSLTTAHVGSIARDQTLGGIRMYTGTSTNWTHLGGQVVNVKDPAFGAVGDGVTNDSTAIQAAMDVFGTTGGICLLPISTYLVDSQLIVPNRVQLIGMGRDSVISASGFTPSSGVIRIGNGTAVFNSRVENLRVACNDIAGSIGIYSTDIQEQSGVSRVLVDNYATAGIRIDATLGGNADNWFIQDIECNEGGASSNGIVLVGNASNLGSGSLIQRVSVVPDGSTTSTGSGIVASNHVLNCIVVHTERHSEAVLFDTGSNGIALRTVGFNCTHAVRRNTTASVVAILTERRGTTTNSIRDDTRGASHTQAAVPLYVVDDLTFVDQLQTVDSVFVRVNDAAEVAIGDRGPGGEAGISFSSARDVVLYRLAADVLAFGDGDNLAVGTTSGTKIGTSTAQKLGFWNATPIVQPPSYTTAAITTNRAWPTTASISTDAGGAQFTSRADFEAFVQVVHQMYLDLRSMGLLK